jgi:hypothetical protein
MMKKKFSVIDLFDCCFSKIKPNDTVFDLSTQKVIVEVVEKKGNDSVLLIAPPPSPESNTRHVDKVLNERVLMSSTVELRRA